MQEIQTNIGIRVASHRQSMYLQDLEISNAQIHHPMLRSSRTSFRIRSTAYSGAEWLSLASHGDNQVDLVLAKN